MIHQKASRRVLRCLHTHAGFSAYQFKMRENLWHSSFLRVSCFAKVFLFLVNGLIFWAKGFFYINSILLLYSSQMIDPLKVYLYSIVWVTSDIVILRFNICILATLGVSMRNKTWNNEISRRSHHHSPQNSKFKVVMNEALTRKTDGQGWKNSWVATRRCRGGRFKKGELKSW